MKDLEIVDFCFSNKGLLPWEGGCLWEREGEKPLLQLRSSFKKKERVFWLYTRQEIIAHELIHAKRLHLNEPIFEEILAYQTSSSAFRRFFGPIFRSSKESLFFALSSLSVLWSFWIFFIVLGFFLIRLLRAQRVFFRAKRSLLKNNHDEKNIFQTMVMMTDKEIFHWAKQKN